MSSLLDYQRNPGRHQPIRLPTYPQIERTSILPFVYTSTYTIPATTTTRVALTRDPVYPLWATQTFSSFSALSGYRWDISPFSSANQFPAAVGESFDPTDLLNRQSPVVTWATGTNPIGTPFGMDVDGNIWSFIPSGMYIAVKFASTGVVTGSYQLTGLWATDFNCANPRPLAFGAPILNASEGGIVNGASFVLFPPSSGGGWFRPVLFSCSTAGTAGQTLNSIAFGFVTAGPLSAPGPFSGTTFVPLNPSPLESSVTTVMYSGCRLTAAAATFRNVTAVLNKEGTVEGIVAPVDRVTIFDPNSTNAFNSTETSQEMRYFGRLEDGVHAFSLPDALNTQFRDARLDASSSLGGVPIAVFSIGYQSQLTLLQFVDLSSPASTLAVIVNFHLEFRNSTMLWPISVSNIPLEQWHRAQISLGRTHPFSVATSRQSLMITPQQRKNTRQPRRNRSSKSSRKIALPQPGFLPRKPKGASRTRPPKIVTTTTTVKTNPLRAYPRKTTKTKR